MTRRSLILADSEHKRQLIDPAAVFEFALLGAARFTLKSLRTGAHFTYRVKKPKKDEQPPYRHVSVLTGQNNEADYTYLGTISTEHVFRHNWRKSRVKKDAPSVVAFTFFWNNLVKGTIHANLQFWHEGRCAKCGRLLTVPESIAAGIGPECLKYTNGGLL
jgi:hypothetical protein